MRSRRETLILVGAAALTGLAAADPRQAAARAWMKAKAQEPGVLKAPKGLLYRILTSGPADGPHPGRMDHVQVRFEARLTDGKLLDATKGAPDDFHMRALIQAWALALPMMRPGDVWELYAPPELAYGKAGGAGGLVPPYAPLIFRLELVSITKAADR